MVAVAVVAIVVSLAIAVAASRDGPDVDRFDRPDGPALGRMPTGQVWRHDPASRWGIQDGRARVVDGPANGYATAWVDTGIEGDAFVAVDVTLSPTPGRANAGLVLRYADRNDHLLVKLELTAGHPRGMLSIGEVRDGRLTSLLAHADGIGLRSGQTYHLQARIDGRVVTAAVRGPGVDPPVHASYALSDEEASAFAPNTGFGLRAKLAPDEDDGGSRWDNFSFAPG